MKNLITLFTLLVLCSALSADELVLKDGKIVKWASLKDLGDTYEVETTDGVKLEVKKTEVVRVTTVPKSAAQKDATLKDAVLTGAAFTFDKGRKLQQFDLLRSIDLKKDAVMGTWKGAGGSITGDCKQTSGAWARLETSYQPPEEYDLTLSMERMEGDDGFAVGLVGGGNQFAIMLDKTWTGPVSIDGKGPDTSGVGVKERLYPKLGTKRTFQFMIRSHGFAIRLDGKDFLAWKGDWSKVSVPDSYKAEKKTVLYFTAGSHTWKIHSAIVTFPKE